MGYIENNLISGEQVRYRAKLHWVVLVRSVALGLLLLAGGALLFAVVRQESETFGTSAPWYIAAGTLALAAIPILAGEVRRRAAEFAVTNKRVVFKVGAISSQTAEMFLNKIESVRVDQSVAGRLLGYGSITVRGTGGSLEPFHLISAPLEFRRQIQEQIGG